MKKSKLEQLTAGVGRKLEAQKPRVAAATAAASALPNSSAELERFTLSFGASDTQRLDELSDYLRSLGVRRVGRSLLLKVALRAVKHSPELVDHVNATLAEDGRRKSRP